MHTHRTHRPDDEREIFPRHPHRCEAQYSLVADDGVHWYGQLAGLREGRAGPEATSRLKRGKGRIGRIFATRIRQTTDHMNVKISHIRCQSRNFAGDGETASPPLRFAPVGITIHWKATSLLTPSPPPLPGAPHPDFLCSFVGSLNFMRLSLKSRTRGPFQRCVQEIRGISLVFREMWDTASLTLKPVSVPTTRQGCPMFAPAYVGRKRLAKPFEAFRSFTALAVLDHWLKEGAVFQEIYQAGSHMIDVVTHCSLGAFTVVCFKGLQDRHVRI